MTLLDTLDLWPDFTAESWQSWRSVLAVVDGTPERCADPDLVRRISGRETLPPGPFRELWGICGRRAGKSRITAAIAIHRACFVPYQLAPGEIGTFVCLATDREQAKVVFRYVRSMIAAVPALLALVTRETQDEIEFGSLNTAIKVKTANYRALRGETLIGVSCDEMAYWQSEDAANPDEEILRAIRPAMMSVANALLVIISSPYRRAGVLWKTYRQSFGTTDARRLVIKADTLTMNPLADREEIEQAYEEDPVSAAAEFGAEFRSDVDTFIAREVLDALIDPGVHERPPVVGMGYRAFVDPSGGSADSFTLAIGHSEDGREILDAVRERRPPFSPEQVVAEFAETLKSYRVSSVTGDRYAGEWPREQFRKHGIIYNPSERNKSEIYSAALPLMNSGRVRLLDDKTIAQLAGLERRTSRVGKDSIDHAPGGHDDRANAVCGVLTMQAAGAALRVRRMDLSDPAGNPIRAGWDIARVQEAFRQRGLRLGDKF
jgi:Terminase large subunit, ATPase domain